MTIRAATANLTEDDDQTERRQALTDIERVGRETTTELRNLLAVLRTGTDTPAPLHPTASLADLPRIIETARNNGLNVTMDESDLGDVPAGAQLTIYTVVREALANALRHAGRTSVDVMIHREGSSITVDIRDAGPTRGWSSNPGTGNGLRGLRERLAIHTGTLTAGPTGSGFRLLALIPVGTA